MNTNTTAQIKVIQCNELKCQNDVRFYCRPCKRNLCMTCKQRHVVKLDTKDHDVVIYRLKYGDFIVPESCEKHPDCKYQKWCKSCECAFCDKNENHKRHKILDIKLACTVQRQEHKERIIQIRGESLPNNRAILAGLKSDFKGNVDTLKAKISGIQQELVVKAENLKKQIDIHSKTPKGLYKTDFYMRCVLKHKKMKKYVHRYEQLATNPIKFLLFVKKTPVPQKIELPDNRIFSFFEEINKGDMTDILVDIKITEAGIREMRKNKRMLKQMPIPMLRKYVAVTDLIQGFHISFVTSDKIWVSDGSSLILTNTKGTILYKLSDVNHNYGVHTVNKAGELIYVDENWNINKLSVDNTTKSTLIQRTDLWDPWCICHSASTGDLLVMMRYDSDNPSINLEVKVIRFNAEVQPVQTIQYHSSGQQLYCEPFYITENHNGDIVVSDRGKGVVVTDREGKYRFSYNEAPNEMPFGFFMSNGICVDALLNILICCRFNNAIHVIDKDGHLLFIISTLGYGIAEPLGLGYDQQNHLVWVGSGRKNKLCIYRHIKRRDNLV
ncbi:uncharacterized protein LOC134251467 [Saccostrea cucullata]|uniref:uncharacterized protein LOC134251467 n=1 Tax=Saccostrea cuccullata TaxID=36930 RepID=UPI002ED20164